MVTDGTQCAVTSATKYLMAIAQLGTFAEVHRQPRTIADPYR